MSTDTPRTDAAYSISPIDGKEYVEASLARELERENAMLRAALAAEKDLRAQTIAEYGDACREVLELRAALARLKACVDTAAQVACVLAKVQS